MEEGKCPIARKNEGVAREEETSGQYVQGMSGSGRSGVCGVPLANANQLTGALVLNCFPMDILAHVVTSRYFS